MSGALATELGAGCDEVFHPEAIAKAADSLRRSPPTLEKLREQAATIVELVKKRRRSDLRRRRRADERGRAEGERIPALDAPRAPGSPPE